MACNHAPMSDEAKAVVTRTWLDRAQASRRYWGLFYLGLGLSFQVTMQVLVVAGGAYRHEISEGIAQSVIFALFTIF
jgi:hypothetical protein